MISITGSPYINRRCKCRLEYFFTVSALMLPVFWEKGKMIFTAGSDRLPILIDVWNKKRMLKAILDKNQNGKFCWTCNMIFVAYKYCKKWFHNSKNMQPLKSIDSLLHFKLTTRATYKSKTAKWENLKTYCFRTPTASNNSRLSLKM